jgi:EAL domain-containing protein (putative c-di-GMP-specific phosphodiesterase class I)
LRAALHAEALELHYQPLVDVVSGRVTGCEALLRWPHPERGFISPAEFIPVAEDSGLIAPLGDWVLRRACLEASGWPDGVKVAVNLSPVQFRGQRNLVRSVLQALVQSGLAPARLELEITERVLLEDDEANVATLRQLKALGVRIAMDDFGTGYSSLSYLRTFPFDKIKIDQSFVRELGESPHCAAIVRAVASLGTSLGITTVAEGVETADQLDHLRAIGCDEFQGFHFSRAVAAGELPRLFDAPGFPDTLGAVDDARAGKAA